VQRENATGFGARFGLLWGWWLGMRFWLYGVRLETMWRDGIYTAA
jgi:hypothetical protein